MTGEKYGVEQQQDDSSMAKLASEKPFKEHMKELSEVTNTEEGSESKQEKAELDPFWNEHPSLFKQAQLLEAPLTVKEFKKQGFRFEVNNGVPSILAPTPEYREWLMQDAEKREGFFGKKYETLEDRLQRLMSEGEANKSGIKQSEKLGSKAIKQEKIEDENLEEKNKMSETEAQKVKLINRFTDKVTIEGMSALFNLDGKFEADNELLESISEDEVDDFATDLVLNLITTGADSRWYDKRVGRNYYPTKESRFILRYSRDRNDMSLDQVARMDRILENCSINPEDQEVRKCALTGFVETLSAVKGEESRQAHWYFEKFGFGDDMEQFKANMNAIAEKKGIGLKRKVTRFLKNHNTDWWKPDYDNGEYESDREREKSAYEWRRERQEAVKQAAETANLESKSMLGVDNSAPNSKSGSETEKKKREKKSDLERLGEMREISKDYLDAYVSTLREDAYLDENYFPAGHRIAERIGDQEYEGANVTSQVANLSAQYGKMKIVKLGDWADYIEQNVDPNMKCYIESVGTSSERDRGEYMAIQFTIRDKTYCIAESINDGAAMYLAWGEAGEDLRSHFRATSKSEAREHENVEVINHLNKENINDSLDQCYAKAFFLLFGGDKKDRKKNLSWGKTRVYPVNPDMQAQEEVDPAE